MTFTLTQTDRATHLTRLPQKAADLVDFRLECLQFIARAGRGKVKAAINQLRAKHGGSFNTWYNKWTAYTKGTESFPPGDWRHLVDKRYASHLWIREKSPGLPARFVREWHRRAGKNKLTSRAAHKTLLQDLAAWRAGDLSKAITGYDSPPPNHPGQSFPRGWSYDNLMSPKNALAKVEAAAARNGRDAAKKLLPGVITTRVNSYPLAEVQFDDMWLDFLAIDPSYAKPVRLLQFGCVDHFTNYLPKPVIKPRLPNLSEDSMTALNEREFRLYFFNFLRVVGWSRRGSIMRMEKGTASLRITSKRGKILLEKLARWAPEITIEEPGMTGAPAHGGAYSERAKGNPNCKALVESTHHLLHQQMGSIDGQTGPSYDRIPGDLHGRIREAETALAAEHQLPELAGKFELGIPRLMDAVALAGVARNTINDSPDHEIEGWIEAGLTTREIAVDPDSGLYLPESQIQTWTPQRQTMIQMMTAEDPGLIRNRKLTRREAWEKHLPSVDRARLPKEAMWDLLVDDFGEIRPVLSGMFQFQDMKNLGPGKHRYRAQYQDPNGYHHKLVERQDYLTFVNPFEPDFLYVGDPKTRALLGYCEIHLAADRTDADQVKRAIGQAEKEYQDAMSDLTVRNGLDRLPHLQRNTQLARQAGRQTSKPRDLSAAMIEAGHTPEDFGLTPENLLTETPEQAPCTPPASPDHDLNPDQFLDE